MSSAAAGVARPTTQTAKPTRVARNTRRNMNAPPSALKSLDRDDFSSNRHLDPTYAWSMIFSENRYPLFGIMLIVSGSPRPAEHVAEVVVDRVQVLGLGIDRAHLDDEAIGDHAIAERLFGGVGAVPGEMHGLAVAAAHARPLRGGEGRRHMLDRKRLDQPPQEVALRRGEIGGGDAHLLRIGALAPGKGQNVAERRGRDARPSLHPRAEVAEQFSRQTLLLLEGD